VGEVVDAGGESLVGASEWAGAGRVGDVGEAGTDDSVVGAGDEERGGPAVIRDLVAVGVGGPLDEAVKSEAAEVVGDLA
jgi:hypothetical protein